MEYHQLKYLVWHKSGNVTPVGATFHGKTQSEKANGLQSSRLMLKREHVLRWHIVDLK